MPTTYIKKIKDDPRDRLEVEIGDAKQAEFYPQLKIKRWDNEVNASFRLLGDTGTQVKEGDKVKYKSAKREAHFYELEEASEFEVILLKKPDKNIIEFSVESKGLDFFYQPELTQEEIDNGAYRPDNVIGSYAVYHSGNPINYVGGKLYRTGKAFHIYRPRIEDSDGNWVWGELEIKNKKMTVTIPQEFLDKAVYPIRHAAGATFGYTTPGSSFTAINSSGDAYGSLFTGAAGTADSITLSLDGSSGAPFGVGIYLHSDGSAVAFSGDTDGSTPAAKDWATVNLGNEELTAIAYVLMGGDNQGNWNFYYDAGDADQGHFDAAATTMNRTMSFSHNNNKYSIYCTYTPGAVNKTVTPSALALSLTLHAPSVAITGDKAVSPSALALTAALQAPSIALISNPTVTPSALALTLAIPAPTPTTSVNKTVTPSAISLALSIKSPTITGILLVTKNNQTPTTATLAASPRALIGNKIRN